ncbi:hypothetical protein BCV72DRAFT_180180, partial [Rhizopus microsporus var. microsporus]
MPFHIFFEDGKGNAMDEDGNECVQTQVDEKAHPLDNITGFNTHSELKPSEKPTKPKV